MTYKERFNEECMKYEPDQYPVFLSGKAWELLFEAFDEMLDKIIKIETDAGRLPKTCQCPSDLTKSSWYCPIHGSCESG